jgi:MFS family permease
MSLEICMVLSLLSLVMCIAAPSPWWFFPVFFLRGAINGGNFVSGISIVYEFTDPENRPTYIGLANTLPGIAGGVAPMLGGWLASAVGYRFMFVVAAIIGILAWVLLRFGVREPRHVQA